MNACMRADETIEDFARRIAQAVPSLEVDAPRERFLLPIRQISKTGRYVALALETPEHLRCSHQRDAQYVTLRLPGDKARFFVLANQPGSDFEFLIEPTDEIDDALHELDPGDPVEVSAAEGPGFPDASTLESLVIFVTGSASAAIKSVLNRLGRMDSPTPTTVYYGEIYRRDFAYAEEFEALSARPELRIEWVVEPEFVQDAFDRTPADLDSATAFVCGAEPMVQSVVEMLLHRDFDPASIHSNV